MSKFELGGVSFSRWADVISHTRAILAKGCRILNEEEFRFAKDLFSYHCNADVKLKYGVKSVRVGTPEYGSWFCFWITDDNGFEQDISHCKCKPLSKKNPERAKSQEKKNSRLKAYRQAIKTHTLDYWDSRKDKTCDRCKSRFNIQVDHVNPFVEIVSNFEQSFEIKKYPSLERHNDSLETFRFSIKTRDNALFVEKWQNYHKQNSKFQLLCSKCNLAKSSSGKRYKPAIAA